MPKKCESCDFFHPENDLNVCPECGETLQLTMFTPPGHQTDEPDEFGGADPWSEHLAPYEEMELPWAMRWAQIGAGIGVYFLISRTAVSFLSSLFLLSRNGEMEVQEFAITYLLLAMILHVIGALGGGAVAGAWSIDWVPQGIGVGVGVFTIPIVWHVVFPPEHPVATVIFAAMIGMTTVLAVFGAFLGHKVVRPFRYVIS